MFRLLKENAIDEVAYRDRPFILPVLEVRKASVEVLADVVSGESLPPGSQMAVFLLWHHVVKGPREPLRRALIPFMRTPSS